MFRFLFRSVTVGWLLVFTVSCDRAETQTPATVVAGTNRQVFQVKGVIVKVAPREKSVEIKHEEIHGYMPAMTMPFDVKDTNELAGLAPGDSVVFRMIVTDTEGWIEQIRKLGSTNSVPTAGNFRLVRDVEPLNIGDRLPEYHFTNQLGQAFSTADFKGQALAITFLFTRCPFPTFCPKMANDFSETQQSLISAGNFTNWHLLTVSFDAEFDKPVVLKSYAERYHYDPAHWTFATGDLVEITAIAEQCGLNFWHDETGSISHNLRTVVFDASGRLQKIFTGNTWKTEELVAEMTQAAKAGKQ
ncbi:MAG TPA: SCO family protein [Methylomirabilota bacterium]|nr:SCO family protein [Methylomirabilota bacterium]